MSEVIEAVADASENTAENTNISASEFGLRRARQMEELIPSEAEPEAEDASISEDIDLSLMKKRFPRVIKMFFQIST